MTILSTHPCVEVIEGVQTTVMPDMLSYLTSLPTNLDCFDALAIRGVTHRTLYEHFCCDPIRSYLDILDLYPRLHFVLTIDKTYQHNLVSFVQATLIFCFETYVKSLQLPI